MSIFPMMNDLGHEQVVFCHNRAVGLRAIIAIHDTTLGPSLGGCRFYPYKSDEEALIDVLRLSRAMTHKAALAGLDLGGGKAVILGDPRKKSEGLFRALGRQIEALGGRYIAAEDMNTTEKDMDIIRKETQHVTGLSPHLGGLGVPGPTTAWGVFHGIRACLDVRFGSSDPVGCTVAIQGVGSVGHHLAINLHNAGANLVICDPNPDQIKETLAVVPARVVDSSEILSTKCDVLAPCAIGGILNEDTIPNIQAQIIAGGANNQLAVEPRDSWALRERDILFAPDYVVNSGGIILVQCERFGLTVERAMDQAAGVYDTTKRVLNRAMNEKITTIQASNELAQRRVEKVSAIKRLRLFTPKSSEL
ncbi:MAG: Glu/Leu/Phe/Val dehydrogenase [Proteobacteria bacterium]|jgi:leucine dehydrogenase|nr:Glu/Leu/Phe/Val dehydrogenase [Pseudomonadota bacterium]